MASNSCEIPPKRPKVETDYELCIKCQLPDMDTDIVRSRESSYEHFLRCVRIRAEYQDLDYISIYDRLRDASAESLRQSKAVWHSKCYSETTNKTNIERARTRHEKAISLEDTSPLQKHKGRPPTPTASPYTEPVTHSQPMTTRSKLPKYDKTMCFFCQRKESDVLIMCQSENIGEQISEIVGNCDNEMWKVNHSDIIKKSDALSKDLKYHKNCMTIQWKRWQSKPMSSSTNTSKHEHKEETISFIAAEMQFYSQLEERIQSGEFIAMDEAEIDYNNAMRDHKITFCKSRKELKKDISQHIGNVEFTRQSNRRKATLIHSKRSRETVVSDAASKSGKDNVKTIFQCAKVVRSSIEKAASWKFQGSLVDEYESTPEELTILLKWIIQGNTAAATEERARQIRISCNNLSQQIMQARKSTRQIKYTPKRETASFRSTMETPLTLGMSLYCYHATRSKRLIDLIYKAGVGVQYKHTMKHVNKIACAVEQNIEDHGAYIPPGLIPGVPIRAALDNIDAKVDTPDGKMSFHALAGTIFQKDIPHMTDRVAQTVQLTEITANKLTNVPETVIDLAHCMIVGNPKPKTSPHYTEFKPLQHHQTLRQSEKHDTGWLLIRHYSRKSSDTSSDGGILRTAQAPSTSALIDASTETGSDVDTEQTTADKQYVPVWTAYNSLLAASTQENQSVDNVHALPLINAPPQDWKTLVTSLTQLCKVNKLTMGPDETQLPCVWLDMDLYKRVLKLAYLHPDLYKDKWIESPGQFHICLCAIRCLGRTVDGSGLDDMWVDADIYSNVTVMQIINGKHYNRAVECHLFTLEALTSLWFDSFFEKYPEISQALNDCATAAVTSCQTQKDVVVSEDALQDKLSELKFQNLVDEFDTINDKYPNYRWIRMYMRQVLTLLQCLRSIRLRQWDLFLASLEQLCIWFFAYNRLDYALNIPEYIARMYKLEDTHPDVWQEFEEGGFTVNTNHVPFTAIGVDQAQEHVNKLHKGDGGISGITNNPSTLLKYCLSTPELARLSKETETLLGVSTGARKQHHDMSQATVDRREKYISQMKAQLSKANPFSHPESTDGSDEKLVHMTKKVIMPDNVAENILDTEKRGEERYRAFVEERVSGDKNLWDPMSKVPVLGWGAGTKPIKTKVGTKELVIKESSSMMARLLVITRSSRDVDLKSVIGKHEFSTTNRMLMTAEGQLHPCLDKSQLIHRLTDAALIQSPDQERSADDSAIDAAERDAVTENTIPAETCLLIDGMAVVQEQTVFKEVINNCSDLALHVIRSIHNKSKGYASTCVVFDDYSVSPSLKDRTRSRRAKGRSSHVPTYKVVDETRIKDFNVFLSSSQTKDLLTVYLAQRIVEQSAIPVSTVTRLGVLSSSTTTRTIDLGSKHEEADTLLILYAAEIHKTGVPVHIYSPDTDVLVIALAQFPELGSEVTLIMGTGANRRHVPLQPIYHAIGERRARALIGFHALSGCDTTGRIFGKSKTAWWNTFVTAKETVLEALLQLGNDYVPSEQVLSACEELMCELLRSGKSVFRSAAELRWNKFCSLKSNQGVETLPPTQGAMQEHIKRAHLQCRVWQQVLVPNPELLEPTTLGWSREGEHHELKPVLTKVPLAPVSVLEMVKCGCDKSRCSGRCSCKDNNVHCTELCSCGAEVDHCANIDCDVADSDISDIEDI